MSRAMDATVAQGHRMNFFERLPPYAQILLLLLLPVLVIVTDQIKIHSLENELTAAIEGGAQTHVFAAKDREALAALENASAKLLHDIDHSVSGNNNANDLICMQSLRNNAGSYIMFAVSRVNQQVVTSSSMRNEGDIRYIDKAVYGAVSSMLEFVPRIKATTRQITASCPSSQAVLARQNDIVTLLDHDLVPLFTRLKTSITQAK